MSAVFSCRGIAMGADTFQAEGYPEFKANRENDLHEIRFGEEHYKISETVIFGS